ncbi:MAG: HAD-IA family hydrolase [Pseudomonadota bacterium]
MGNCHKAVLFDLDGTLIDTAPDLVGALFATCDAFDAPRPAYDLARSHVANGGVGLVALALGDRDDAERSAAYRYLLDHYATHIADHSTVYPAWANALASMDSPWGVVTNKPQSLADALFKALAVEGHTCLIGGDLLAQRKPDPAPLVFAAGRLNTLPQNCIYIGDHERDIRAANAAGMCSVGVSYGYLVDGDDATDWSADYVCDSDSQAVATVMQWLADDERATA